MSKRRVILIVIGGVVWLGVFTAIIRYGREFGQPSEDEMEQPDERDLRQPEYGGKKLSEWMDAMNTAEAEDALDRLGTNALPYLIRWSCYERPPSKRAIFRVVPPNKKEETAKNVLLYLCSAEEGEDALSRVLIEATRLGRKRAILFTLHYFSEIDVHDTPHPCVSTDAMPSLLVCLKSTDPDIRAGASDVVWKAEFLLRSHDWYSKQYATNFLRKVNPQSLENAKP